MGDLELTLEEDSSGAWYLRASNLAALRERLGAELLRCFCACFLQADRVTSLWKWFQSGILGAPAGSTSQRRDFLVFYSFLAGTLKEFAENLQRLRAALAKTSLYDQEAWEGGLKHWEQWGQNAANSALRNQLLFHVNEATLERGLERLCQEVSECEILSASDPGTFGSDWFFLAHWAFLLAVGVIGTEAGATEDVDRLTAGRLLEIADGLIDSPAKNVAPESELAKEFVRVIKCVGLSPRVVPHRNRDSKEPTPPTA